MPCRVELEAQHTRCGALGKEVQVEEQGEAGMKHEKYSQRDNGTPGIVKAGVDGIADIAGEEGSGYSVRAPDEKPAKKGGWYDAE